MNPNAGSLREAKRLGLRAFAWGDPLRDSANVETMRAIGVDGLVRDGVKRQKRRRNIFETSIYSKPLDKTRIMSRKEECCLLRMIGYLDECAEKR